MKNNTQLYEDLHSRLKVMKKNGYLLKAEKLGSIIKMLEISNETPSGLCIKAKLSKTTLNKLLETNNPSVPSSGTLDKLAKALRYDSYDDFLLMAGKGATTIIEVPIMATIPGGAWQETVDHITDTVQYIPREKGIFKGVRIVGNSINRLIEDGAIAIIDISQTDPNKLIDQLVVIECNGETTAKIYRRNPERFEPYSDDPGFTAIYPDGACKIIGRIMDSMKRMPKFIR